MSGLIREDQWHEIDELLFQELNIVAVKRIRELADLGLKEALELMQQRHQKLQREQPEKFGQQSRVWLEERE